MNDVQNDILASYREQIDAIDMQILSLLSDRTEIVEKVGELKAGQTGMRGSFIRPGRESNMVRHLVRSMRGYFPRQAVAAIWRLIISASLQVERQMQIALYLPETLSREQYGQYYAQATSYLAFCPVTHYQTAREAIEAAVKSTTVTILAAETSQYWWRPLLDNPSLRIFAYLPFTSSSVSFPSFDNSALYAIAQVTPEVTGEDCTIVALSSKSELSLEGLKEILAKQGIGLLYGHEAFHENQWHYLVVLGGFMSERDGKIARMRGILGSVIEKVQVVGAYATPVHVGGGLRRA